MPSSCGLPRIQERRGSMDCGVKPGGGDDEDGCLIRSARRFALRAGSRAGGCRDFLQGKTLRIVVGSGVGSGYDITARTLARHLRRAYSRQSDRHRAKPARRRRHHHDQLALRHGPVRRHGDRGAVQRHADHAALVAAERAVRCRKTLLYRQHQPRNAGHVCLVHGAGADARRRQDHRAGDGRAGAGVDAIRLSGAARSAARLQIQGRHRLREHAEDFIWRSSAARCRAPSPTGRP